MKKVRVTKIFNFETSHALFGYDGKCKNIHGHSYKLFVTVLGEPVQEQTDSKNGMLIDFGELKKIVKELIVDPFDHAIILNQNSPHAALGEKLKQENHDVIMLDYQPTCENMLIHFAGILKKALPDEVELVKLKLFETENSYGEWLASDNIK